MMESDFDLQDFVPYLLNQAADATSRGFETYYKSRYGMLRTEWRVVFHLGRYGKLTAKEICTRARIHKTKVSRAVHALETKRYLERRERPDDRRHETLSLTPAGTRVFNDLVREARRFDAGLLADFSASERAQMRQVLRKLAQL
ncbi:MAG: MarR family winged helix-turn-helix transcriptional regulator [Pseudomonadota bacterium]